MVIITNEFHQLFPTDKSQSDYGIPFGICFDSEGCNSVEDCDWEVLTIQIWPLNTAIAI